MASVDIQTILSKATSLTKDQIRSVLNNQSVVRPITVGEALASKEFSTADEVVADLCKELGLDFIRDIPVSDISVDLIRDIPINYAKQHNILPYKEDQENLVALTSNPVNLKALDDLKVLFGKRVRPLVTTSSRVQDAINKVYEKSTANLSGLDEIDQEDYDLDDPIVDLLEAGEDDAPVIKMVNSLLFRAVKEKASDIHVEPYEKDMAVRFRTDGILFDVFKPPKKLQNAITSRIKVMANLNIAEKRLPQDGRIPLKVGGKDIDIRLSTVPTPYGERLVMRIQDRSSIVLELTQLGFSGENLDRLDDLLARSYGIFLVTGPTGSGKSTTLYGALTKLNKPDVNILTVEDPVEQRIHGVGQVQVNAKIGLTFAAGLRSFLRQDPDIIMVGEVRDLETAELAIQASLTGHLVLSTLHTNDSAGAFPRLIDFGVEPFLIATSIQGVVAQRLVRVLCPHCKAPYEPSDFEIQLLGVTREEAKNGHICRAMGCNHCNQKGYSGRTTISELLIVTDDIRSLIMQRKDGNTIKKQAVQNGMKTFRDHGVQKVLAGITTIEELTSNTQLDI
ncbi:type II secretion system ATPase GspE [Bdellovibrio reynosensis]|uniref:protein-secreting ATPase n=1 Tax=Bdellovibrio reynosensis TaxID=2835041 RepID=A0ABY4CBL2_9BACT|nr:type II secretion system ATPase GspE [Bdellovibrio reynosensis]UOF02330.1 type II secretion system ATPase GspE [Bdellovibrio reynosensis]